MRSYNKSIEAFEEAKQVLPGGVNSPVRAFKSVNMSPIFMSHGKGSKIYDIDGNEYIDYVLSWGPLILGHSNERVVEGLKRTAETGTSFGAPTLKETELAKLVIERVPSIEVVRMVNSGTEATMSALRLARGFTGRNKILKFERCNHAHADSWRPRRRHHLTANPAIVANAMRVTMTSWVMKHPLRSAPGRRP